MTSRYFCKKCGKELPVELRSQCPFCGYKGVDGKSFKYYFGEG